MGITTLSNLSMYSLSLPSQNHHNHNHNHSHNQHLISFPKNLNFFTITNHSFNCQPPIITINTGSVSFRPPAAGGGGGGGGGGSGGGGESSNSGDEGSGDRERNKSEALLALAEAGRSLESIPKDFGGAIEAGRVPGEIVKRYFELEKSAVFRWLLRFGGFKERLLADDLFLTKVAIECGVGIFTKVHNFYSRCFHFYVSKKEEKTPSYLLSS